MGFGSLLSWWQWAILAAIPPAIVALYFLKLRRQPLEVPSTYLWRKSIEDLHVNSFWQRMRRSALLFLQLAFVAILAVALWRPYWEGDRLIGSRFVFLVDNSASMSALDGAKGAHRTRLAEAKLQVGNLISRMKPGDAALLISFSNTARVEQSYSENQHDLQSALAAIAQTNRPTDIREALHAAAGLATQKPAGDEKAPEAATDLYIFSDGKFPEIEDFPLGNLHPIFVPLGDPAVENVGITAFNVQRNEEHPERLEAYCALRNFGSQERRVQAELYHDAATSPLDVKQLVVPPGQTSGELFDLRDIDRGTLRLQLADHDLFPLDDEAFALVGAARRSEVLLVTPGNEALALATSTADVQLFANVKTKAPEFLPKDAYQQAAAAGEYDLIIYDRCAPTTMPQANTLFIGSLPPAAWQADEPVTNPIIIDEDRAHPLMQSLELGDILIGEARPLKPPIGNTRLIESQKGTLLAIVPREGFEDAVLGFELMGTDAAGAKFANTNWTIKLSFPVFVLNALNYLGGRHRDPAAAQLRPGTPFELQTHAAGSSLTIRLPDGQTRPVERNSRGKFLFQGTEDLGVYTVLDQGKEVERFTVNLFDPSESDIRPRTAEGIKLGSAPVAATTKWEPARQETWKWLAVVGLCLLFWEWYIFNRRIHV
ncbi:MAG TPA: BatA and WFA domain-containing protein [Pirellulales bacterium]|jgi:hypothetical protein|nr:BatA and WFA domain-containing protein [Pirellulales bacterium]